MCVCYCTKPKAFNEVKRYHCPSLVWYVQKLQKTRWCYFLCLYLLVDCAALDKSFDVSFHVVPGKKPFNSVAKNLNVLPRHYHAEQRLCVVGCLCDEPGASRRIKWWPPPTPWSCFPWLATTSGEDKRNASLSGCSLYKLADPSIMLQSKIFHWLGQWQRSNVNCRVAFSLCNVQICLSWHIPEV